MIAIQLELPIISNLVDPVQIKKAMDKSAKKAVKGVRSLVKPPILEKFTLEPSKISKNRGGIRGKASGSEASVLASGKRIGLIYFKHSPTTIMRGKTSGGVTSEVRRGEIRHLPHSFVTTTNAPGIFHREGKSRLPIKHHSGISIPEMMDEPSVTKRIADQLLLRYETELARALT